VQLTAGTYRMDGYSGPLPSIEGVMRWRVELVLD
jgi:hypothetical protein